MGMFDIDDMFSNAMDEMFNSAMKGAIADYEVNRKRPGIDTLTFKRLPAGKAEEVRNAKTGLFGGGTRKKLAASIEEGRTTCAEVLALAREYRDIERGSDNDPRSDLYQYYYKIADLDGNVLREDIPAIDNQFAVSFELNDGDSASDTGCADKVDPGEYLHMFLLRYYLKDEVYFVLLTREQFENLAPLVKHAGSFWHRTEDGTGYKW